MANAPLRHHVGRALLVLPATPGRALRFVITGWLLALVGILAVQQLHAGLHEHVDLAPGLHLMRDGSLAVPFAAISIALAGLLSVQGAATFGVAHQSTRARLGWALLAAFVFAALSAPGNEMHALLFGADEEEVDWLADIVLDSSVVFVAALVVLVPAALSGLAPWPPDPVTTEAAGASGRSTVDHPAP